MKDQRLSFNKNIKRLNYPFIEIGKKVSFFPINSKQKNG